MLDVRNRRPMGKMARESRCYRRQGRVPLNQELVFAERKRLGQGARLWYERVRVGGKTWNGRLCTPAECTRMAKSVGVPR